MRLAVAGARWPRTANRIDHVHPEGAGPMTGNHSDAMIVRLEKEIEERSSFIEGVIANAQDGERDLTDNEKELTVQARSRISSLEDQLKHLYEARERTTSARQRAAQVQQELTRMRNQVD